MTQAQLKYFRDWRAANPDKVKAAGYKYRNTHKEIIAIRNKDNYIPGAHVERYSNNKAYYRALTKKWADKNKEKVRMANLLSSLRRAGMSVEEYTRLLGEQSGLCALCGKPPMGKLRLSVDHSHVTGRYRKLLCVKCNAGLGQFGDNPELLRRAADYLELHDAN